MKNPMVSIIVVDYKKNNPYLVECLKAIQKQSYEYFEVILVTDYPVSLKYPKLRVKSYGHYVGPAEKRDEGAKMSKGEILAFIDDDAYPSKDWLKRIVKHFKDSTIAGVGGPGITPPNVSWQEEASGWSSASPIGSGAYTYRFLPGKQRFVDDYPSMNLAIRKSDFEKVGGFDSSFWPGEDTKLCMDLTHKLGKKLVYDPEVVVYHHRRPIWKGHLKQNGSFGLHRGFFARILPKTSFKPIYFAPSALVAGILYILFLGHLNQEPWNYIHSGLKLALVLYIILLSLNSFWVLTRSKSLFQAVLSVPVIFVTHVWYGVRFLQGFLFTGKLTR